MITEFIQVPLPEATDDKSLSRLLDSFAASPLPAFVIRQVGKTHTEALQKVSSQMPENMRFSERCFDLEVTDEADDMQLHLDLAQIADPKETIINLHFTQQGAALGSFFLPGIATLERAQSRDRKLPEDTQLLFEDGYVDTQQLGTHCHRARVCPGDAILFKEGLPLVHDFTTVEFPRVSFAAIGHLTAPHLLPAIIPPDPSQPIYK